MKKRLFSCLMAFLLVLTMALPMGACTTQEGGENMANILYNGVELPDIRAVWSTSYQTNYPYVMMYKYSTGTYRFGMSSQPAKIRASDGATYFYPSWKVYEYNGIYWELASESTTGYHVMGRDKTVTPWGNHDIYYTGADPELVTAGSSLVYAEGFSKLSARVGGKNSLYNGVELPPFPDVPGRPYIAIRKNTSTSKYDLLFSGSGFKFSSTVIEDSAGVYDTQYQVAISADMATAEWTYIRDNQYYRWTVDSSRTILWSNHDILSGSTVYTAASEPEAITEGFLTANTATVQFTCSDLLYTDSVYKVQAWAYYQNAAAVYISAEAFGGPSHLESCTFTGLAPNTEYEVYAVILANDAATEHSALTAFTTLEGEAEAPILLLSTNEVTANGFTLFITTQNLTSDTEYTAEIIVYKPDSSAVVFEEVLTIEGSSGIDYVNVTGLEPATEYAISVDIYPSPSGEVILHGDHTETTLEAAAITFDRDSFLLGMASGLGATAATKTDADHRSWAMGYIVGEALRSGMSNAWAEVVDGVLYLRQADSAAQTDTTLEVE